MAASPMWKVYLGKSYRAATKQVEDAACLVAFLGEGATIRVEHTLVVWREGSESQSAAESYDHVTQVAYERLNLHRAAEVQRRTEALRRYEEGIVARRKAEGKA